MEVYAMDRARLVRLFTYLTGDADAAEDLCQETLLAAWQHAGALRDPQAYDVWLNGIARNMFRRWARRRSRERAHLLRDEAAEAPLGADLAGAASDRDDLD